MKTKNESAVALGKLGGKKRWNKVSTKKRKQMMTELALKRWTKKKEEILTKSVSTGSSIK